MQDGPNLYSSNLKKYHIKHILNWLSHVMHNLNTKLYVCASTCLVFFTNLVTFLKEKLHSIYNTNSIICIDWIQLFSLMCLLNVHITPIHHTTQPKSIMSIHYNWYTHRFKINHIIFHMSQLHCLLCRNPCSKIKLISPDSLVQSHRIL